MDVKECLERGLLKKEKPSLEMAKKSIEAAKRKLDESEKLLKLGILDMAEVSAYSAMFHAARALLFRDGFREKSHYALYVYLKEKYSARIEPKFLNELNILRMERHEIMYGLEKQEFDSETVTEAITLAEEFIKRIGTLL